MKRLGLVSAAALLVLAAASHTFAEPPAAGRDHERERLERQRDRVLEQLRQRGLPVPSGSALPPAPAGSVATPTPSGSAPAPAPSGSAAPVPFGSAAPGSERLAELARRWRELGENRLERRERNRAALVRQLGQRLSDPQVKDELKLHATRTAELTRLRFLAENARSGAPREKLLARIAKLSARETERHQKQLTKLAAAGASAPSSSSPAHAAPPPNGAKP